MSVYHVTPCLSTCLFSVTQPHRRKPTWFQPSRGAALCSQPLSSYSRHTQMPLSPTLFRIFFTLQLWLVLSDQLGIKDSAEFFGKDVIFINFVQDIQHDVDLMRLRVLVATNDQDNYVNLYIQICIIAHTLLSVLSGLRSNPLNFQNLSVLSS